MLEGIRFVNCQSFDDVTISFAQDKLNVLVAPNNTGKSVLFKMLKITADPNYFPSKQRNLLIRRGATSASMICAFTDGSIGITTIFDKGVVYRYKHADEEDFSSYTEPPEIYLRQLGLIVDRRSKFVANIIDTDQDMLLVNSDQKGNHELIKLLAENENIMQVKEKISNLITKLKRYNSDLLMKEVDIESLLKSINVTDVAKLKYEYELSVQLFDSLKLLTKISQTIAIITEYSKLSTDYNHIIETLDSYIELTKVQDCLGNVSVIKEFDASLISLVSDFCVIQNDLRKINFVAEINFDNELIDDFLAIMNQLEQITIFKDLNPVIDYTDSLISINSMKNRLGNIDYNLKQLQAIESAIYVTQENMRVAGKNVKCPIHGEVVYNGQECVPYNI